MYEGRRWSHGFLHMNARIDALPVIAVGASAGGIEAIRALLHELPETLPAAILIVVHRAPVEEDARLARVLGRRTALPVRNAADGMRLARGSVVVCPAGVHLLTDGTQLVLSAGPRENRSRPSIDVLFRSVASHHGARGAGVLLSGTLDDGTAGLAAIKASGGSAFVQDPDEAMFGDMPDNAIERVDVDVVAPVADLAAAIVAFAGRSARATPREFAPQAIPPTPSLFSCPDCHGVLSRVEEDSVVRYRCRTGHAFSPGSLDAAQESAVEEALFVAYRSLVERVDLLERLANEAETRHLGAAGRRFRDRAQSERDRMARVRGLLGDAHQVQELLPRSAECE